MDIIILYTTIFKLTMYILDSLWMCLLVFLKIVLVIGNSRKWLKETHR